jgi:RimJ/RimL family protein N-acetyltransferase
VQNPFLIGERIYLRPLECEDAGALASWLNDSDVTRFMLHHSPMSLLSEQEWLRRISESTTDVALGIVLKENDRLIGTAGLHQMDWRNRHAAFGIMIGVKDLWSQGYGTEATALLVRHAFETLNLHRVWLHVYEYNARGIRAYEKVGFRPEGRLRQDNFLEGRYHDTLVMGLLRDEWQAGQARSER